MKNISIKLWAILTGLNQGFVFAQGIIPSYPQTTGMVANMVYKNDTVIMTGNFSSVYYPDSIASYGTIINQVTGKPAASWSQPNGIVNASTPDGNGGIFIGGDFSKVGGQNAGRIAHLNNQGQLSNLLTNSNVNGVVKAMATLGDTLFVGGQFSLVGEFLESAGAPVFRHTNWVSLNFPTINGDVDCAIPDGQGGWYVTGNFTSVGGILRNRAARIDGNGNVLAWNPNINGRTLTMTTFQDKVYLGGSFSNVGGIVRSGIASVDTATGAVSTWNPGTPSMVIRSFSKLGNILYVAGAFNSIAATSRANIASFNLPSGTLTTFNTTMASAGASLFSVVAVGNKVFVGGSFNIIGGVTRINLACLDAGTGNTNPTWNANTDNRVNKILYFNGRIYAGGAFNLIRGLSRTYLASADTNTGIIHAFTPNLSGEVVAMEIGETDSNLYISGNFTNWYYSYNLLNHSGSAWPLKSNYFANTLSLVGSRLFVGGAFNTIGGAYRNNLAAFSKSTGALLNWNPDVNSRVEAICNVKDSFIFVAGYFSQIGSFNRDKLASFNRLGNLTNFSWGFGFSSYLKALAFGGDSILYVGGNFSSVSTATPVLIPSVNAGEIAALNFRTGRFQPTWNPNANYEVNVLLVDSNIVYAGGTFTNLGGQSRNCLGAIFRNNALATSFNVGLVPADIVNALSKDGNNLIVGGVFNYAPISTIIRKNLASFNVNTNGLNKFISEPNLAVNCLTKLGNQIYCGGNFTVLGALSRNNMAAFLASNGYLLDFNVGFANTTGNLSLGALEWVDDYLFVGGQFNRVGDSIRTNLGMIHIPTQTIMPFNPIPNGIVYSIYYHQNYLYIGGQFTNIGGNTRNRLAIFNYPSLTINAINPNFSGWPLTYAAINNSKIILGGGFTTIGGISASNCATFNLPAFTRITSAPLYTNPLLNGSVVQTSLIKNQLFVAGGFNFIGGISKPHFAIIDTATLLPTNFVSNISGGSVSRFDISDGGNAYLSGSFTTLGGVSRSIIGSISTITGLANNWSPSIQNINSINPAQVNKILTFGNKVIIAGRFNRINGIPMNNLVVLYGADTTITITSLSASGNVCPGANLNVNFAVNNNFGSGNQFFVELVDTGFPFKPAIQIGSLSSSVGGAISCTIPRNISSNTSYLLQIRSSNPSILSAFSSQTLRPVNCSPTIGPSNLIFSNITQNSATLSWTRGNGANCILIGRFGSAVNTLPQNGRSYLGNAAFGMGDTLGNGNFVLYVGPINSINISLLSQLSNYHFAVIEFNGNNSSADYLNNQALYGNMNTLPVAWLLFNGNKLNNNNVQLNWATAQEINNQYFGLERKIGKQSNWKEIAKIKGSGNSFTTKNYQYLDLINEEDKTDEALFYRIKQVDFDGLFSYSKTIQLSIEVSETASLVITPNPFVSTINLHNGLNQIIAYKIYKLTGELVQAEKVNATQFSIDGSILLQGVYIIEVQTNSTKIHRKIIKI
jgi:hypothetical protein